MFEVSGKQRFPVVLRLNNAARFVCCYIFGRTCVLIVVCLFLPPTSGLKSLIRMFFLSLNAFSPPLSLPLCRVLPCCCSCYRFSCLSFGRRNRYFLSWCFCNDLSSRTFYSWRSMNSRRVHASHLVLKSNWPVLAFLVPLEKVLQITSAVAVCHRSKH